MRLHELIIEQDSNYYDQLDAFITQKIIPDCKPFLGELGWSGPFLYRGIDEKRTQKHFTRQPVRKNRRPMDTPQEMHQAADNWFVEHYGYPFRRAGLFTTGNINQAVDYGRAYMVFPIGDFQYVWSPGHYELLFTKLLSAYWRALDSWNMTKMSEQDAQKITNKILDAGNYQSSDLQAGIRSGNEVLIGTSEFYGIRTTPGNFRTGPPRNPINFTELTSYVETKLKQGK